MRVAYLTSQYPAPSHTFIRREVAALRARGLDIVTLSIRRPPAGARATPEDREETLRTSYVLPPRPGAVLGAVGWAFARAPGRALGCLRLALRHRVPGLRAWVYAFIYFVEALIVARWLRRAGAGHLHNHFANPAATVGLLAARYCGLPWSLTLHGISELDYPAGLLLPEKVAAARFVACVSHFGRAQAMRLCRPEDWPKLFIARCSVDAQRLRPADRPENPVPVVISVGRLSPEKGQLGLVEAFAQVRRAGVPARLRLVGDGPDRARVEQAIAAAGLAGDCELLGQLSETETLTEVARADVLVSSSFMEGLPVVLIEALALGVPAIAPRVAGIPELIEDGVTGLLFHPGDFAGLAACLRRMLAEPALRERCAREGRTRIEREYAVEQAVQPVWARLSGASEANPELAPLPMAAAG